jgi:macrolide-specific efflux system membrane fusion protein
MTHAATWTLLTALTLSGGSGPDQHAAQPRSAAPGNATIPYCQVFLIDDVEVPAQEAGTLAGVQVQEGEHVRQGQLLAQIDDRQAQFDKLSAELKRDVALAKANDDIEVRYSQASFDVADAELKQSEEIHRRSSGSVSAAELRRLRLTRRRAELQIDRSRLELTVAAMSADIERTAVAAAAEAIDRRRIVAPFDGMVLEIVKQGAEWVDAGEPVLRIIRLDRLRVEGFLDVRQFNPEDVLGKPVTIQIQRARDEIVRLPGQVVLVSPLVQAGDKYRVRAEVQNRVQGSNWLLGPGMSASMTIHVMRPTAAVADRRARRE